MRQRGDTICTRSHYDFTEGLRQPLGASALPADGDAGAGAEEDALPAEL